MGSDDAITMDEVKRELNTFHDFVDRAVSKRLSDEEKEKLRSHLTPDFELVKETELVQREDTVDDLDEATSIPPNVDFEAKDPEILHSGEDHAYVRYVYSVEGGGKLVQKYATAMIVRDEDAPDGLAIVGFHNPGGF